MAQASSIAVRITDWHDPAGAELRARQMEEILSDIEGEDKIDSAPSAADIEKFIVMEIDGKAIACAGLRPLPPADDALRSAEVKRMFVTPEQRGAHKGVTSQLMEVVEAEAKARGYTMLKLATGARMHRARAFYERDGFVEIPLFGSYLTTVSTVCYAKSLA